MATSTATANDDSTNAATDTIMTQDTHTTETHGAAQTEVPAQASATQQQTHQFKHLPPSLAALFPTTTTPPTSDPSTATSSTINNSPSDPSTIPVPSSPSSQNTRKAELMRKFTLAQIKALHEEEVAKVHAMIETDRKANEDVRKQIELLEKQRELERRIYWKTRGGANGMTVNANPDGKADVKTEQKPEDKIDAKMDEKADLLAAEPIPAVAAPQQREVHENGVETRDFAMTDGDGDGDTGEAHGQDVTKMEGISATPAPATVPGPNAATNGEEEGEVLEDGEDVKMDGG